MRTEQDQLIDLTETILNGMRKIMEEQGATDQIILHEEEGQIIYALCELIATGSKETSVEIFSTLSFEGTPIICQ